MFKYVVLLALVPAIFATTGVSQCRDKTPMPESIDILGCLEAPCPVALGTKAQMTVGFIARKYPKQDLNYTIKYKLIYPIPLAQ